MTQIDIIAAVACAISGVAALFSGIALYQSAKANRSANQASERGLHIDLVDYRMNIRNAFTSIMDEFEAQRYGPADNDIIQAKITFRDAGIFFGNDVSEFLTELIGQISTYSETFKTRTMGRLIFDPQGDVREEEQRLAQIRLWVTAQRRPGNDMFDRIMTVS